MDEIGQQDLWSFENEAKIATVTTCRDVQTWSGNYVKDYTELAGKVAELQFRNRDYVLLFRGQSKDYKSNGRTTLRPSIFRIQKPQMPDEVFPQKFERLQQYEEKLLTSFSAKHQWLGLDELQRYRILRWSILQHYEVCDTPLLDLTHSLRIAASFASQGNESGSAYLFVVGVPNISGAITANAEAGLQILRLSSVCPPVAMRPHIQEGYLVGEYPEIGDFGQKRNYSLLETDFARRLVAKFKFDPKSFWTKTGQFQMVGEKALYPSKRDDPVFETIQKIKTELPQEL